MITIKKEQLKPGMIVLAGYLDYGSRHFGKMKNNLTIPRPFLVLKVKRLLSFHFQGKLQQ